MSSTPSILCCPTDIVHAICQCLSVRDVVRSIVRTTRIWGEMIANPRLRMNHPPPRDAPDQRTLLCPMIEGEPDGKAPSHTFLQRHRYVCWTQNLATSRYRHLVEHVYCFAGYDRNAMTLLQTNGASIRSVWLILGKKHIKKLNQVILPSQLRNLAVYIDADVTRVDEYKLKFARLLLAASCASTFARVRLYPDGGFDSDSVETNDCLLSLPQVRTLYNSARLQIAVMSLQVTNLRTRSNLTSLVLHHCRMTSLVYLFAEIPASLQASLQNLHVSFEVILSHAFISELDINKFNLAQFKNLKRLSWCIYTFFSVTQSRSYEYTPLITREFKDEIVKRKPYSSLAQLTHLTELEIGCRKVDVVPIHNHAGDVPIYVESFDFLSSLVNLKRLALVNVAAVERQSDGWLLPSLPRLTHLTIYGSNITQAPTVAKTSILYLCMRFPCLEYMRYGAIAGGIVMDGPAEGRNVDVEWLKQITLRELHLDVAYVYGDLGVIQQQFCDACTHTRVRIHYACNY